MRRFESCVVGCMRQEDGAVMVEYALMLVLTLVVRFGAGQAFGTSMSAAFGNLTLSAAR